ncbi:MAG TPA: enolase C-terminal domain-like protein [Thermoanaerobaculia bacterium]|nr:enolase C-terminal domain-like protein [Thermoanaerobaculia bacterium]
MNAFVSRYTLTPRARPNARSSAAPREGALVRVGPGVGDLHPWPELGDLPLDAHLASIASGRPTPLARRTLDCAAADGEAREHGISLFEGLSIPPSHYSALGDEVPDFALLETAGFSLVKMKAGPDRNAEIARFRSVLFPLLKTSMRLRIDFNYSIEASEVKEILESAPARLLERIDFLEDPVPPDPDQWTEVRRRWNVKIAADREKPEADCWDVAVIKPASESDQDVALALERGKPLVFTSAMDHPIGQLWAAWNAAIAAKDNPGRVLTCGLLSHGVYDENPFSEGLSARDAVLIPPDGAGLGFDDLLERLEWKRLT